MHARVGAQDILISRFGEKVDVGCKCSLARTGVVSKISPSELRRIAGYGCVSTSTMCLDWCIGQYPLVRRKVRPTINHRKWASTRWRGPAKHLLFGMPGR